MSMAEPGPPSPSSASAQLATPAHAKLGLGGPGFGRKIDRNLKCQQNLSWMTIIEKPFKAKINFLGLIWIVQKRENVFPGFWSYGYNQGSPGCHKCPHYGRLHVNTPVETNV
jgi:hypothetical protein